jgi:hypothetical protein
MPRELPLQNLHERHRALTVPIACTYEEAASVCLQRHHTPPADVILADNGSRSAASVNWTSPDQRTRDAWANDTDATRDGAYGCVIAGVEALRGLYAVRRAETGTGADYYIGPPGSGVNDLEECFRLEVSGVDDGDEKEVLKRLSAKVRQARAGNSSLPAVAGVFGFRTKLLTIQDVPESS